MSDTLLWGKKKRWLKAESKAAAAAAAWSSCDASLLWLLSFLLDSEDILATIKPWQSHYVGIDCSCCVTDKTGCVHVVWTRAPVTFGHLKCSLCLLLPHYVRWALSLCGSMTLSLIGKVILLLPRLLTAKWHINDNGTEGRSHWCILSFWAEVDQTAFSVAVHCNLTFYIQCVEMLIFYNGWSTSHVDSLITNSSRCFFFTPFSHAANKKPDMIQCFSIQYKCVKFVHFKVSPSLLVDLVTDWHWSFKNSYWYIGWYSLHRT